MLKAILKTILMLKKKHNSKRKDKNNHEDYAEDNAKGNLSSVKGLARNHSWKNLIKMEKSQVKLFDIPESCDCYDG